MNGAWTGTLLILSPYNRGPHILDASPPHRKLTEQTYSFSMRTTKKRKTFVTDRDSSRQEEDDFSKKFCGFIVQYMF